MGSITNEEIAAWESERNSGMTSALGEYTPPEFWRVLDELKRLRAPLTDDDIDRACRGAYEMLQAEAPDGEKNPTWDEAAASAEPEDVENVGVLRRLARAMLTAYRA